MTPTALSIAQHLTDARDLALRLFGDRYEAEIAPYCSLIRKWAGDSPRPLAEVCMELIKRVDRHGATGDMLRAQAACYEELSANDQAREPQKEGERV